MLLKKMPIESSRGGCSPVRPQKTDTDVLVPDSVRSAAVAAFDAQGLGDLVLDLVADTWVGPPVPAITDCVRRLRFAGHGWEAVVDVRRTQQLTLDVRISSDEPASIEVRTADASGRVQTQHRGSSRFEVAPGLMSVLIRRPDHFEHQLARTAWVWL